MDVLETRLTREYGIRYPFVGAGMGFVSLAPLAAAVTEAGGMGMVGAVTEPPDRVRALIREVRQRTAGPFGVDFVVGESAFGPLTVEEHLDVCRDEGVSVIVFHMDTPPAEWVRYARTGGARVWKQVASVEEAQAAVEAGVDGLIAQGAQSGGHCRAVLPLNELLPSVAGVAAGRLVLAAGGIADGRSAARALTAGADGVWVGTRLLASSEANAHPEYQRRVVAATGPGDTVVTTLFGPEHPGEPLRCLRNRVVDQWVDRPVPVPPLPEIIGRTTVAGGPYPMPKFSAIPPTRDAEGDFDEMCLYAGGESCTAIADVQPAAEIVRTMMEEARALLEAEAGMVHQ